MMTATAPTTLAEIDQEFQQLECLGHGGFGSVFLAQKQSGRKVALKFIGFELDCNIEEEKELFQREIDAVLKLECQSTTTSPTAAAAATPSSSSSTSENGNENNNNRDLSIVFFEDWFIGERFAAIVMQYSNGGTLADEIESKNPDHLSNTTPYTERRIAWYALQLCEALAHAHSRGIYHYDVKSSNVLIDRKSGGKLLLADFGSAIAPGEEPERFSEIYACPELQDAYERDDFANLEAEKVDAFGLGAIIFELLCCKKLVDLTADQTLAQFITEKQSVDAALDLPCLRLPWANTEPKPHGTNAVYSDSLRGLVRSLLEPNPAARWTPTELQKPLRQDSLSPLLAEFVSAAQPPEPGAPVTIDNIQLGMFIQRGCDWCDGDSDGGIGSVGVVVQLDADAGYTEVAFPSCNLSAEVKSMCCRIGAGNKYELQIGPTPVKDFLSGTEDSKIGGLIFSSDAAKYSVGQTINDNCMVVGTNHTRNQFMVAPLERIPVPAVAVTLPTASFPIRPATPRKPMPPPESWKYNLGSLIEVVDEDEKERVILPFFAVQAGGLDIQRYEILSIKRVQNENMWNSFANTREQILSENWGIVNEQRLFHGSGQHSPEALLISPAGFYERCTHVATGSNTSEIVFSTAQFGNKCSHRLSNGTRQMIMSRVALGRVDERVNKRQIPARPQHFGRLEYHSIHKRGPSGTPVYAINNPFQAYPEYIMEYKVLQRPGRRVVRAARPRRESIQQQVGQVLHAEATATTTSTPAVATAQAPPAASTPKGNSTNNTTEEPKTPGSASKMCVVCFERPVNQILIPCGHLCLCSVCGTKQGLAKLKQKCPECRQTIRQVVRFYGKVVEE